MCSFAARTQDYSSAWWVECKCGRCRAKRLRTTNLLQHTTANSLTALTLPRMLPLGKPTHSSARRAAYMATEQHASYATAHEYPPSHARAGLVKGTHTRTTRTLRAPSRGDGLKVCAQPSLPSGELCFQSHPRCPCDERRVHGCASVNTRQGCARR
jgi:hypothetical protein